MNRVGQPGAEQPLAQMDGKWQRMGHGLAVEDAVCLGADDLRLAGREVTLFLLLGRAGLGVSGVGLVRHRVLPFLRQAKDLAGKAVAMLGA